MRSLRPPEVKSGKFLSEGRALYAYKNMMTPYQKLVSLLHIEDNLKPDVSLDGLKKIANEMTDNDSARQLKKAKEKIFSQVFGEQKEHA